MHPLIIVLMMPVMAASSSSYPGLLIGEAGGYALRGTILERPAPHAQNYSLLGVGYCRGGPPGGEIAITWPSIVRDRTIGSPDCFDICTRLARCSGVELRDDNNWCELQIPTLYSADGSSGNSDWGQGADAAQEIAETTGWSDGPRINSGSPSAITTSDVRSGFYCWKKVMRCDAAPRAACEGANRYPCEEGAEHNLCGPCVPLHIPADGSQASAPNNPSNQCVYDTSVALPPFYVSLASPWLGGQLVDETLYLSMIYGVKKAFDDRQYNLIPILQSKWMPFQFNITGHTDEWGYTLSSSQLQEYAMDASWDTRIENHPMSGIRAMSGLKQDSFTTNFGLQEMPDERTRPHAILGSTGDLSVSSVMSHANVDLAVSAAATFYETPVLGWASSSKAFADTTLHGYYLRVNPLGLDYHLVLARLLDYFGYTRVGVVTTGVNQLFVRALKDTLTQDFFHEDMSLGTACSADTFVAACYNKFVVALEHLRAKDVRIVIQEQDGVTQLDPYFGTNANLFRDDTLYIMMNTLGNCQVPMIPPTSLVTSEQILWENLRRAAMGNNAGEWNQMGRSCRVCPNWALVEGPPGASTNITAAAHYNLGRLEGIYTWSQYCADLPDVAAIETCFQTGWCNPGDRFWVHPSCEPELQEMRAQYAGSMCIGVADENNAGLITAWTSYLASLTADELVAAGAPRSFFDIFESGPLFAETGKTLADMWSSSGTFGPQVAEKAALIDSLLLSLVAFTTWVRSSGDQGSLISTALRQGFRSVHNTAIPNWMTNVRNTEFQGLTGTVKFNSRGERIVDYTVYSAQGAMLAWQPVASYDVDSDTLAFSAQPVFNDGTTSAPPDKQPPCAPGTYYTEAARGCIDCPAGMFCRGGTCVGGTQDQCPAIHCDAGRIAPGTGWASCCDCPVGAMSNANATECITCPSGRHSTEQASPTCNLCPAGRFWRTAPYSALGSSNGTSLPQCVAIASVSECEPCARGDFSSTEGATECSTCSGGSTTFSTGVSSADQCLCPEDSFMTADGEGCMTCGTGLVCPIGTIGTALMSAAGGRRLTSRGTAPTLMPRYYNDPADPLLVYRCRNEIVCPGGEFGACGEGAVGIACGKCINGYYETGGTCMKCNDLEMSMLLFPVFPAVFGCPLIFAAYMLSRDPLERMGQPKYGLGAIVALTLAHLQLVGLLYEFNIYLPDTVYRKTWEPMAQILTIVSILRPKCRVINEFSHNYILQVLVPMIAAALFVLTYVGSLVARLLTRTAVDTSADATLPDKRPGPWQAFLKMDHNMLFSVFGTLVEVFLIGILRISFMMFHCYDHPSPNNKKSLFINPDIICYSSEHTSLFGVAIVAILLYCVGYISGVIYALQKYPAMSHDRTFQKRCKFLLAKYRPTVYFWGVCIFFKSVLLSLTPIILEEPEHQLAWAAGVLLVYLLLQYHFNPWRHQRTNEVDFVMNAMMIAVTVALLHYSRPDPASANKLVTFATSGISFLAVFFAAIGAVIQIKRQLDKAQEEAQLQQFTRDLKRDFWTASQCDDAAWDYALHRIGEGDRNAFSTTHELLKLEKLTEFTSASLLMSPRGKGVSGKCMAEPFDLFEEVGDETHQGYVHGSRSVQASKKPDNSSNLSGYMEACVEQKEDGAASGVLV